jgi:hypothetical protein
VFTVADVRHVQADLGLLGSHVVWFDLDEGFSLAHTDAERASGMDLYDCVIHWWLAEEDPRVQSCCFADAGFYVVTSLHKVKGLAL